MMTKKIVLTLFVCFFSLNTQLAFAEDNAAECEEKNVLRALYDTFNFTRETIQGAAAGIAKTAENSARRVGAEIGNIVTDENYEKPEKIIEFNMPERKC